MSFKPVVLAIMDGFGIRKETVGNAVFNAKTPNLDKIFSSCPYTELEASGAFVGLPEGQMGNSEVGHMNIGAGRIVYQDLTFIDKCISDGSFFKNENLAGIMSEVSKNGSNLHLMGLVSDGGVHSSINHLFALLKMAHEFKIKNVFIHAWTDGRDTGVKSAGSYISAVENLAKELGTGEIKTICGRFYAMDRDKRIERTTQAFEAMANAKGAHFESAQDYLKASYDAGLTDEFIVPAVKSGYAPMSKNDAVICFNFRTDRARQISEMFLKTGVVKYFGFTRYEEGVPCIFSPREVKNTIGEYLSKCGLKQLRIAETEKYAHVTFFLNAGAEKPFENESRMIVNSPKVKTYDLAPEMSAEEVTTSVLEAINSGKYDVIFMNYANPDMVGHTGNFNAAIQAVEKVDECIGRVCELVRKSGGVTVITADHGNAEKMIGENGEIFTAHTTSKVPFAIDGFDCKLKNSGSLCDIAPTLLEILKIKKPAEMTGQSLIEN